MKQTKLPIPVEPPPAETMKDVKEFWRDLLPDGRTPIGKNTSAVSAERLERRGRVAKLWLTRSLSQTEISERLGIARSCVSKDIQWLLAQYVRKVVGDVAEQMAAQLARLDIMEDELWQAWEHSFENEVTVTTQTTMRSDEQETRDTRIEKGRIPDPRYMALIQGVWDRRTKLLGLERREPTPEQESLFALFEAMKTRSEERERRYLEAAAGRTIDQELEDYQ
jgi:predicted transcriptional regulator